ncbi:hypothetical protein [Kitasatospora sp. CB01950]|uniref:hypothetical protein n=1 Tax=Kitasatospora sp. CB01950 TaxID=1703930 RepID=UPI001161316F|nr:hypothetical protein [Kitasatospora sp. CB01950]
MATGLAEGIAVTLEQRKVTREMGEAVWENLPLVLAALSDFADKGHAAAVAHLTAAGGGPGREDKARQRSEATGMMVDAEQAEQLRQCLLAAGRRLNDDRVADLI